MTAVVSIILPGHMRNIFRTVDFKQLRCVLYGVWWCKERLSIVGLAVIVEDFLDNNCQRIF